MHRYLFVLLTLLLPVSASADWLDLLPLKRIERKAIYPLSRTEVDPAQLGLKRVETHRLERGARTLLLWTLRAPKASAPTVLYFHGNAGNLAVRAPRFATLQAQGFNVIAMSYPGSSGSGGLPSESTILADAKHVYQNASSLIPGVHHRDTILYGESLGSAVAIGLLASLARAQRPSGTILEAPFTSTPDMARAAGDVPENLIARISDRWDSASRAGALTTPLLILHGTADEVTPFEMGRALFNAAPVQDKDFVALAGATHSETWRSDSQPRMWRFIRRYGAPSLR